MIGVDTNVLVLFITKDDQAQSARVFQFLKRYHEKPRSIFINDLVLCELLWVLISGYHYKKSELLTVLNLLLSAPEFCFDSKKILIEAFELYKNGLADFSDYVIFTKNKQAGCENTYSFDLKPIKEGVFPELA